jgi:tricarballylate dehydrogenase
VQEVDVAVVGGGSAALEAAVAARQEGAERVVLLEKAPEDEFGGNARFSPTVFRFVHEGAADLRELFWDTPADEFARLRIPPYTAEDYLDDLRAVSHGRADPALCRVLVEDSRAAVRWMLELGFRWDATRFGVERDGLMHMDPGMAVAPRGGGLGQLQHWRSLADGLGVELRFSSRVSALHGDDREIRGLRVSTRAGDHDLHAGAVILCAGGFQARAELRARHLGPNADLMKICGSRHDTGEVLAMAIALGAGTTGDWQGYNAGLVDGLRPDPDSAKNGDRAGYAYGITVNRLGVRFFDEGRADPIDARAAYWPTIHDQPDGVAFQLFDASSLALLDDSYDDATRHEASTVAGLADGLGIDAATLERTVAEFNAATRDTPEFEARWPDGRRTEGLALPKSNWALRLDTPPFVGYPVTTGITFSFGGLQINEHAEVLNVAGDPIHGLYASGDVVGFYYDHHLNASGQTRNAVFSRRAAVRAARLARRVPQAPGG